MFRRVTRLWLVLLVQAMSPACQDEPKERECDIDRPCECNGGCVAGRCFCGSCVDRDEDPPCITCG